MRSRCLAVRRGGLSWIAAIRWDAHWRVLVLLVVEIKRSISDPGRREWAGNNLSAAARQNRTFDFGCVAADSGLAAVGRPKCRSGHLLLHSVVAARDLDAIHRDVANLMLATVSASARLASQGGASRMSAPEREGTLKHGLNTFV